MKGIVLAGGTGTRLFPMTTSINKHLLPIYDKPMIYYPLSILMGIKIKDILLIIRKKDYSLYEELLGDGSNFGVNISYAFQEHPKGIADALKIGKKFIKKDNFALILGDNIFFGDDLFQKIKACKKNNGATIFTYPVSDPKRFGIANIKENVVKNFIEKPKNPKSNLAVTGLYFYDKEVFNFIKKISPSMRGELEITDINNLYLKQKKINHISLSRGITWLDAGTSDSIIEASQLIKTIQNRQGFKIGCLEEISYNNGWINKNKIYEISNKFKNDYGNYLKNIIS